MLAAKLLQPQNMPPFRKMQMSTTDLQMLTEKHIKALVLMKRMAQLLHIYNKQKEAMFLIKTLVVLL